MSSTDPTDAETYGDYSIDDEGQLQPGDTLDQEDVDDPLDRGFSPPEKWSAAQRHGNTPWEAEHGEPLDDRLAQEIPEPDPYLEAERADEAETENEHEAGDRRSGRLVAPDEGVHEDVEKDLVGSDVGIDGAASSAEEAAMHEISEDDLVALPEDET